MRFWSAVRFLQQEYDGWQNEKDNERQAFDLQNEKEALIREKRSQLSNEKAKMISEQAETKGKKMIKLVRFIDADGKTRLIEEIDAHFSPSPSYEEYDSKSNEENEIKRDIKKRNSLGSIESNQPIPVKTSLKSSISSSDNDTLKKKSKLLKNMDRSAAILQSLDNSDEISVQSLKSTLSRRSNTSSVGSSLTKASLRSISTSSEFAPSEITIDTPLRSIRKPPLTSILERKDSSSTMDSHITDIDSLEKTKLSTPTFWNNFFCVASVSKEDNADYFEESIDGSTDGKQAVLYTDDGRSDSASRRFDNDSRRRIVIL